MLPTTAFANSFFFTIEASREVRMIKNNYNCMFNEEKIVLPSIAHFSEYCPGRENPGFPGGFSRGRVFHANPEHNLFPLNFSS